MKTYFYISSNYLFTDLLMLVTSISGSIICYKNKNKFKEINYLYIYPLLSAAIQIFLFVAFLSTKEGKGIYKNIEFVCEKLFLIAELISLCYFFYTSFIFRITKRISILLLVTYLSIFALLMFKKQFLISYNSDIYNIQTASIVLLGILGLYEIFIKDPVNKITNLPIFWVITGSLLYSLCTLPIYIAKDFIFSYSGNIIEFNIYAINYFFYSIFFILISRSAICKQTETQ